MFSRQLIQLVKNASSHLIHRIRNKLIYALCGNTMEKEWGTSGIPISSDIVLTQCFIINHLHIIVNCNIARTYIYVHLSGYQYYSHEEDYTGLGSTSHLTIYIQKCIYILNGTSDITFESVHSKMIYTLYDETRGIEMGCLWSFKEF